MKRICLIILAIVFYTSFLNTAEPKFKFTFGTNIGNVPLKINKTNRNIKTPLGIKIHSWILSPNFSSFAGDKKSYNYLEDKNYKDRVYIKLNLRF